MATLFFSAMDTAEYNGGKNNSVRANHEPRPRTQVLAPAPSLPLPCTPVTSSYLYLCRLFCQPLTKLSLKTLSVQSTTLSLVVWKLGTRASRTFARAGLYSCFGRVSHKILPRFGLTNVNANIINKLTWILNPLSLGPALKMFSKKWQLLPF